MGFTARIGQNEQVRLFDSLVTEEPLRIATRRLFERGDYGLAVEEGYKYLESMVRTRSGLQLTGADLMRKAFSLSAPKLKLTPLKSMSDKSEQIGYMDILAGCMTGIRNPRAHTHGFLDKPLIALELLALANHLSRRVSAATKCRRTNRP